ncbi:MAG: peptidase U62 [Proteobacteria bacterium]|nr:MAG: peptidase U62 [Pseudomonadota bacterium]PIE18853.1 MAG: peptidase U62 [Pseudomonadota bacterium]
MATDDPCGAFERRHGLYDELYQRLLDEALATGGDYADLFFQQRTAQSLGLEDQGINRASRSEDLGVGVRVLAGDACGYAFCEELDEAAMLEAARVAAAIARSGGGEAGRGPAQISRRELGATRYPITTPWRDVTTDARVSLLERLDKRAFANDGRVQKVRARLADAETEVLIVDGEGRKRYDLQPMSVISCAVVMQQGDRREEASHSFGGRWGREAFEEARLDELVDEAVARASRLLEAVQPAAGEMPVVLGAGASGILLHEAIGHGMEADFNRKGTSIYADALGESIAAPFVSIVDDGTQPNLRGSINVDDEGVAAQRTTLVEGGKLVSYIHDRLSAKHYGVAPTGNGRRQSFRHPVLPRMRTTFLEAGAHGREEILRSVNKGIYAESFSNGQVQIGAGDFTFYIKTGYLIEDGKLTAPIKDVNLIGNGPEVLRAVEMVADDLVLDTGGWTCGKEGQSVPVSHGMPTVKVSAITVGGVGR